jgi:hypothetical protein
MSTVTKLRPKQALRLQCSACGAQADAACDCGVAYISAGEYAAKVAAEHPEMSNRAVAEVAGISKDTVRRARQSGGANEPPETRTGRDGKQHPVERKKVAAAPASPPEESAQARKALYAVEAHVPELEAARANSSPVAASIVADGKMVVEIDEGWRDGLASASEALGIPEGEYADFLMQLGNTAFNRKIQSGLSNRIEWWLIEMHSKYPDTFEVSAWEGSCGHLAIDKLYERRGIPVGKYQEWKAERDAKENEAAEKKAELAAKMKASGMADKMAIDRELKRERQHLKSLEDGTCEVFGMTLEEAIADSRKEVQELEEAAKKAADVVATKTVDRKRKEAKAQDEPSPEPVAEPITEAAPREKPTEPVFQRPRMAAGPEAS